MNPVLYSPIKPVHINQPFGANVAYYKPNFGTDGHPGIDFMAEHGHPVYAAHDGSAIYLKDAHGGEGIYVYTAGYYTIYWHLIGNTDATYKLPIPFDNAYHAVKAGDLIGYADNTGAPYESTGDHLHFGLVPTDQNGNPLNKTNGFDGCVDPEPYFNGMCAQDIAQLTLLNKALVGVLQQLLNYLIKNKT